MVKQAADGKEDKQIGLTKLHYGNSQADQVDQATLRIKSSKDREPRNKLSMEPEDVTFQLLREITDDFSDERILGRGAFGVVYKGVTETKEVVAVKMLGCLPRANPDPDLDIRQFRNEFDKLVMLKHQNVVQIFGYCFEIERTSNCFNGMKVPVEDIHIALCLEYLPNGSLQNHISEDKLDWHTRYKIIKGICDGLKYIHEELEQPIYHLDLKPGNILLDENMVPKISDFGLSKIFNEELTRTTQSPLGTPGYQPPEYIDRGEISKKFDIFSLGVMMIEIVSGPKGRSIHVDMPNDNFIDFVKKIWRNNLPETCSRSFELYCLQIETCTRIALTCIEADSQKRPNIVQMIHALDKTEIGFGKLPKKRGYHETTSGLIMNNEMKNTRKNFNLMSCSKHNEPEFVDVRETSWNVGEQLIVGRKDKKDELVNSLLKGMAPGIITILPIYGIGGIGKTTFAELIYNDTKFKYYSRVWVHVSPRFDLNKIGNSIISQLSEKGSQANERETISSRLTKLLSGKKILIVLDDLWEDDQFQLDGLKAMLKLGDRMNTIVLVTTRSERVAGIICTSIEPYRIEPLTDDMCWEIIRQRSGFDARDNNESDELEDLGKDIARKCRGVALAAQSLGYMKCEQWPQVKDNDIWKDASLPNHVLASLKLSYSFMDPHLKPCFTYCAIFPKGHKIEKYELIHQWISLGFINPTRLHSPIQLSEKYIEQLKGLSFIQHSVSLTTFKTYHEEATLFTMHDLVHDLAALLLGNQIMDQSKQGNAMGSSCQYALLTDCSKRLELCLTSCERLVALRFLDCCRTELSGAAFAPASSLRVLDLSKCSIQKLPDSIGLLKQLRYLNAPEIKDHMVPECITKLANLMYLSFHGSSTILALPESIGQMEGLIYLDLSGCSGIKKLPESFGNLKNLEHVDFTNCYSVTGVSQCLGTLTKLQYLDLSHCKNIGDLPIALGSLTELQYLNLSYSSYVYELTEAEFLGSLTKLKYLNLSSGSRSIRRLPEALGSLTKLNYLNLSGCCVWAKTELPRSFQNLCSLVHLDLSHCGYLHVAGAFSGFTKLQYLHLSDSFFYHEYNYESLIKLLDNLTELRYLNLSRSLSGVCPNGPIDARVLECICTLTNLEYLNLSQNSNIYGIPEAIANLGKLHTLELSSCSNLQALPACLSRIDSLKCVNTLDCHNLDRSTVPHPILLPQFTVHAGDGESSSNLFLLEDENPEKFLEITGLGNVKSAEEALRIKLVEKRRIKRLELVWTRDDKRFMEDNEVLKELLPPDTVINFKLIGYRSINFPSWVMGIATYLPNLTTITLWDLPNCIKLPPLGQLPKLENLTIGKMDSIRKIGEVLYGGIGAFPKLEELSLEDMVCLEDWNMPYSSSEDSLNEHMLPSLECLFIMHCPRLRLKPWLVAGDNGYLLSITSSDEVVLSSWEGRGHVGASSAKCDMLEVERCAAPLYQWRLLCHLPCLTHLWIKRCQDLTCSSPDVLGGLSSLQKLVVSCCGRITSLPDCLGDLTSLEELRIHRCRSIRALPDNIRQLTNLRRLVISRCPYLELWCQSEENKMKLAHIDELKLMGDEELASDIDMDSDNDLEPSPDSLSDHESDNDQDSETDQEEE